MDDRVDFRNTPPPSSSVVMEGLELYPATADIQLPNSQSYIAIGRGSDGKYYPVTAGTTFTFQQADGASTGSCPDGTCRPPKPGEYIITGTFIQPAGPSPLTASATLLARPAPRQNSLPSFAREHITLLLSVAGALLFATRLIAVSKGNAYTATILLAHTSLGDAIRVLLMEALPILLLCSSLAAAYVAGTLEGCGGVLVLCATCILLMSLYFYVSGDIFAPDWDSAIDAAMFLSIAVSIFFLAPFPVLFRRVAMDVKLDARENWRFIGWLILFALVLAWLTLDFPDITTDRFWLPREHLVFADEPDTPFNEESTPLIGYVLKTTNDQFVILNDDPRIIIEKKGTLLKRDFCYPDSDKKDFEKATGQVPPLCPEKPT